MDMGTTKISPSQMLSLMVLFELGSAVVVGVGLEAKQDAWIAILLGMLGGLLVYPLYARLMKLYPGQPLTAVIPHIVGRPAGVLLSAAYILYFLYIAARVLRDFGELLVTSTLGETPLAPVIGLMMGVVIYAVYQGLEVVGRTAVPVLVTLLFFLFLGLVLLIFSGEIDPVRLLPIAETGWKPIFKTAATQTVTFPFGEMIVFTMLLPALDRQDTTLRTGIRAIFISGMLLTLTIACDIMVLGVKRASISQFPLLDTFSKISVGDFLERLDIMVVSMLILGMFFKITVFLHAGVAGVASALRIRKEGHRTLLILGLGAAVYLYSLLIAGSFAEHIRVGLKWVPIRLHWPIQFIFPLLLLAVAQLRRGLRTE